MKPNFTLEQHAYIYIFFIVLEKQFGLDNYILWCENMHCSVALALETLNGFHKKKHSSLLLQKKKNKILSNFNKYLLKCIRSF